MIKQLLYFGDTLVYSTENTDNLYKDIVIKRAAGMVPSMTLTAEPGAALPQAKKTIIRAVTVDTNGVSHEVFRGTAVDSTTNFYKEIEIVCEGIASRLNSVALTELKLRKTYTSENKKTVYMEGTYTSKKTTVICYPTLHEQLEDLEDIINAQLNDDFDVTLQVRNSTAHPDWSTNKSRVKLDFERGSAMELINAIAQNAKADLLFDGNVVAFVPKDYVLTTSSQDIEFGVNLTDLSNEINYQNLCTTVIPYGCYYSDSDYIQAGASNPGESWHRLDLEQAYGGSLANVVRINVPLTTGTAYRYAVEDSTQRQLYGRHIETVTFDDVTDYNTLYYRAVEYMNARNSQATLSLSALDLSGYGDYAPYTNVAVESAPHGLTGDMRICESEMHFGEPDKDTVTIGSGTSTITGGSSSTNAISGFGKLQISDKIATQVTNIVRERVIEHINIPEEVVFGYYNDADKGMYQSFDDDAQTLEEGYYNLYSGDKDVAYIGGVPTHITEVGDLTLNRDCTFTLKTVNYGAFYDVKVVDPYDPTRYVTIYNVDPSCVVTRNYTFTIPEKPVSGMVDYLGVFFAIKSGILYMNLYAVDNTGSVFWLETSEGVTRDMTGTAVTPDYTYTLWPEEDEPVDSGDLRIDRTSQGGSYEYSYTGIPATAIRFVEGTPSGQYFNASERWAVLNPALYLYNEETGEWLASTIDLSNYYTKSEVDSLIPTNTSDLINDSGFITNTVSDLANYYLKTQTYTQAEVDAIISSVIGGRFVKVNTLPTASADTLNKIYLVPKQGGSSGDVFDEYITIEDNGSYYWEQIGTAQVDLTGYVKTITVNGTTYSVTSNTTDLVLPDYPTTLPASDVYAWAKQPSKPAYSYNEISGTPTLATVATSGSYEDLSNKPSIPTKTSDLTNDSNYVSDASYVHTDNNYTTTEKNKLSGIASGAEVNVQGDWNQTNSSADDYIKNKPDSLSDFTDDVVSGNYVPLDGNAQVYGNYGYGVYNNDASAGTVYKRGEIYNYTSGSSQMVSLPSSSGTLAIEEDLPTTDLATATGNPITIYDSAEVNVEGLVVDLEPIQDLHGYDKPWAGGEGKNKFIGGDGGTDSGVTCIKNNDGSYSFSGQSSTTQVVFTIAYTWNLPDGSYIFTGGSNKVHIGFGVGDVRMPDDAGSGVSFTINNNSMNWIQLIVPNDTDVDNVTVYPMVRLANVLDDTWEPYSNICPIEGWDSGEIGVVGKNLFNDSEVTTGKVLHHQTGMLVNNSDYYTSDFVPVTSGNQYTFSGVCKLITAEQWWYDENKQPLQVASTNATKTVPNGACYFRFSNKIVNGYIGQIEIGNQATTYEPYQSNTATITFGQTVYGGTMDFKSGVVTVTREFAKISDLTLFYEHSLVGHRIQSSMYVAKETPNEDIANIACEIYQKKSAGDIYRGEVGIGVNTDGQIWMTCPNSITSVNDFVAAYGDYHISYELATSETIQLTPQQLQLLKDYNYLSTNGTTINLTYQQDNFMGAVKEYVESYCETDYIKDLTNYSDKLITSLSEGMYYHQGALSSVNDVFPATMFKIDANFKSAIESCYGFVLYLKQKAWDGVRIYNPNDSTSYRDITSLDFEIYIVNGTDSGSNTGNYLVQMDTIQQTSTEGGGKKVKLNLYSSDGLPDYSTSEKSTNLKWIDGKTIYQKTYTGTTAQSVDISDLGIDTFIGIDAGGTYAIRSDNNQVMTLNWQVPGWNSYGWAVSYNNNDDELLVENGSGITLSSWAVTIRYTI